MQTFEYLMDVKLPTADGQVVRSTYGVSGDQAPHAVPHHRDVLQAAVGIYTLAQLRCQPVSAVVYAVKRLQQNPFLATDLGLLVTIMVRSSGCLTSIFQDCCDAKISHTRRSNDCLRLWGDAMVGNSPAASSLYWTLA